MIAHSFACVIVGARAIFFMISYVFFAAFLFTAYILVSIGVESCVPLFYELSCENTYPIAEGVTSGLLTWLNNVVGAIFLLILMLLPGKNISFFLRFISLQIADLCGGRHLVDVLRH